MSPGNKEKAKTSVDTDFVTDGCRQTGFKLDA